MTKLFLDQGLPRSTSESLRKEGWDVVHAGEIGMARAGDLEILAFARREGRIVLTLDADFHAILAVSNASGPSVIRFRIEGMKGPDLVSLIRRIWPKISDTAKEGAMITVGANAIRIRKLPIST